MDCYRVEAFHHRLGIPRDIVQNTTYFRQFWAKELRHTETVSDKTATSIAARVHCRVGHSSTSDSVLQDEKALLRKVINSRSIKYASHSIRIRIAKLRRSAKSSRAQSNKEGG